MMATIALLLLISSLGVQIFFVIRNDGKPDPVSHYVLAVIFVLLAATTIQRSLTIDFVAITSIYEALVLFSTLV
ncbi:MAG: hypothetical protein ABIK28_19710, partial [Planctomycetota bacterium]